MCRPVWCCCDVGGPLSTPVFALQPDTGEIAKAFRRPTGYAEITNAKVVVPQPYQGDALGELAGGLCNRFCEQWEGVVNINAKAGLALHGVVWEDPGGKAQREEGS